MTDARELLRQGLVYQKAGAPARALEVYREAFALAEEAPVAAEALRRQSHVHRILCQWDEALHAARESAATAQAAGLPSEHAEAVNAEAAVYQSRGEDDRAVALYATILSLTTDERILGLAQQNIGTIAARNRQLELADARFLAAYRHFERAGYAWGQAHVLNNITALSLDRGEYAEAEVRAMRAVEAARDVNDLELHGSARSNYAEALFGLGRVEDAEAEVTAAVGHFTSSGNLLRRIEGLRLLGRIAERRGNLDVALRFHERALADAEAIGAQAEIVAMREQLARLQHTAR